MNNAQQLLKGYGIQPRPDFSNHDTFKLRHRGDLDALRIAAHEEGPASLTYARYMTVLQQGLDESLPDSSFLGAIPQSVEDQSANLQRVQRQSEQRWTSAHTLLHQVTNSQGIPLAQLPASHAHDMAALLAADGHREQAQMLMNAISLSDSSNMGIEFIQPEEDDTHYVAPDQRASDGDAYTQWRAMQQQQRQGIQALQIQSPSDEQALFAGVSADGMTYNVADDWSRSSNNGGSDA